MGEWDARGVLSHERDGRRGSGGEVKLEGSLVVRGIMDNDGLRDAGTDGVNSGFHGGDLG